MFWHTICLIEQCHLIITLLLMEMYCKRMVNKTNNSCKRILIIIMWFNCQTCSTYREYSKSILEWISLKWGLSSGSYCQHRNINWYISSGAPSGDGILYPPSNISLARVLVIPLKERWCVLWYYLRLLSDYYLDDMTEMNIELPWYGVPPFEKISQQSTPKLQTSHSDVYFP